MIADAVMGDVHTCGTFRTNPRVAVCSTPSRTLAIGSDGGRVMWTRVVL